MDYLFHVFFSLGCPKKIIRTVRFVLLSFLGLDTTKPTTQPRLWLKAKLAIILETTWNFAYVASFLNDTHCKNVI